MCLLQSIVYDQMEETSSKGLTEATFKEHGIISLAVLKLISCVPKIADFFFPRVLDISELSVLASTFLAHDDELEKLSFFLSVPQ